MPLAFLFYGFVPCEQAKRLSRGNGSTQDRRKILCVRKLLFRFHAAEPGQCGSGFEPEAPVQQIAEHRRHKAAEIGGHKLPPEHHQAQHQHALKDIRPCAQGQHRKHLGKGVLFVLHRGSVLSHPAGSGYGGIFQKSANRRDAAQFRRKNHRRASGYLRNPRRRETAVRLPVPQLDQFKIDHGKRESEKRRLEAARKTAADILLERVRIYTMTGGIFANQSPGEEINFWLDWLSTDFNISLSDRQLERFLALYERLNRGWPPIELHLETMSASPPDLSLGRN